MCEITAPMPYCEASVSSFNGNFSLKCVKMGALDKFVFELIERLLLICRPFPFDSVFQ